MALKINSASGSITLTAEDGSGNADVSIPRSGIGSVSSLSDLSITATASNLNTTAVTTLGTVEASKVVTADANGDVTFPDGEKVLFGTGADLQLFHDGTQSVLADVGTGPFKIRASDLQFNNAGDSAQMIQATDAGAVTLFHNGSSRIATTSLGADITGELIADSYNETYAAVTSSSNAATIDCHNGNAFSHTLTENTTLTFSNPPASGTAFSFSLEIIQDASASGFTVTFPSSVDWPSATAPTLTATASAKDLLIFYTRDGGTTWLGFTAGQALG